MRNVAHRLTEAADINQKGRWIAHTCFQDIRVARMAGEIEPQE